MHQPATQAGGFVGADAVADDDVRLDGAGLGKGVKRLDLLPGAEERAQPGALGTWRPTFWICMGSLAKEWSRRRGNAR
jgi:hypothetical protein